MKQTASLIWIWAVIAMVICSILWLIPTSQPDTNEATRAAMREKIKAEAENHPKASNRRKVISKIQAVENRFSAMDAFAGGAMTKSTTVFYLVADGGEVCEVGISDWSKTKEGDLYDGNWETK